MDHDIWYSKYTEDKWIVGKKLENHDINRYFSKDADLNEHFTDLLIAPLMLIKKKLGLVLSTSLYIY